MIDICETLFEPLRSGAIAWKSQRALFLNAHAHGFLSYFQKDKIVLQQYFKPYAVSLVASGYAVQSEMALERDFALALVLFPKNMVEGQYLIASALRVLKSGGTLVCAADNKAGGTRLKKLLSSFGLSDIQESSKNKARVVWGSAVAINEEAVSSAIAEGEVRSVLEGAYLSQAGVFGWDKIDRGSALLARVLPKNLDGKGADFGCGYGYLARSVLERATGIKSLACIDADYRAVELCRKNLEAFMGKVSFGWCDLTKPQGNLKRLDFVIMNPPFHDGKKTDIAAGVAFVENAALALRTGGSLWMVANTHLPYEAVLNRDFSSVKMHAQEQGFKVYQAIKANES